MEQPPPRSLDPHPNPESPLLLPRRRLPIVASGIILVSAAMFFVQMKQGAHGVHQDWDLYAPGVRSGQWWRLLTYALEHGNVLHLALNMSVVYTLGFQLERVLGTARFAVISVVTCLGAAAVALFLSSSDKRTIGASGMILGWAGAMLPIATRAGRRDLGVWLAQIVVISLFPGISWQAHLGGFLSGLPCGVALRAGRRTFALLSPILLALAAAAAAYAGRPFG